MEKFFFSSAKNDKHEILRAYTISFPPLTTFYRIAVEILQNYLSLQIVLNDSSNICSLEREESFFPRRSQIKYLNLANGKRNVDFTLNPLIERISLSSLCVKVSQ